MARNAIVAQSGGPTTVINSSACGVIQEAMKSSEINRVIGATNGILGVLKEDLFDISAEKPETIDALRRTPAAAIGSCRHKLKSVEESKADFQRIIDVFEAHDIGYFFYAGGNDSMDTADKINKLAAEAGYDLVCMGVPKTVDNDLACTDHCPGYPSVAKFIAASVAEAGKDTEALYTTDTCTILEVMGRNAGWIALAAGLAQREPQDAPHLIWIPEKPKSRQQMMDEVRAVHDEFSRVFIVVGEGMKDDKGNVIAEDKSALSTDAFGHAQRGGVGETLKTWVMEDVGIKARAQKPGTNQRAAMHFASLTDVNEAYMSGQAAVQAALNGVNGKMVTLVRSEGPDYKCTTGFADLKDVANGEKEVPAEFINAAGNGVTEAFKDYLRPLVQGEAPIEIGPDGVPVFMRFERKPLEKKLGEYKI